MSDNQQKFQALLNLIYRDQVDSSVPVKNEDADFILGRYLKITNSWEVVKDERTSTPVIYDANVVDALEAHLFSKYPNEQVVYRPYQGGLYAQLMNEKVRQITYTLDGIIELFKAEDETARRRLLDTVSIQTGMGKLALIYVTTSNMLVLHENAIERAAALCKELFNSKKLNIQAGLDGQLPRVTFDPIVEETDVSTEEEITTPTGDGLFHPHQKVFTAVLLDHVREISRTSKAELFDKVLGAHAANTKSVLQNGPYTARAGVTVVHHESALQLLIEYIAGSLKIAITTPFAQTSAAAYEGCTDLIVYRTENGQVFRNHMGKIQTQQEEPAPVPQSPYAVAAAYREEAAREIFRGTVAVNELAGNPSRAGHAAGRHQLDKIILPEVQELKDGFDETDLHEIIDGAGDVLFTTIGLAGRYGFDIFEVMRRVVASQFTKFDRSAAAAHKTKMKYLRLGVDTYVIENTFEGVTYYVTKVAKDAAGKDGKHYPAHKWLKSFAFDEPLYGDMITEIMGREERQAAPRNDFAGDGKILYVHIDASGVSYFSENEVEMPVIETEEEFGVSPEGLKLLAADLGTKITRLSDLPEEAIQLAGSPKWEAVLNKLVEVLAVEVTEADLELFLSLTEGDGVDPDQLAAKLEGHEMAYLKHMDITVSELMLEAARMESDVDSETLEMARLAVKASFGPLITKLFGEGSVTTSILGTDLIPTDHKILFAIRVEDDVVVAISFKPEGL